MRRIGSSGPQAYVPPEDSQFGREGMIAILAAFMKAAENVTVRIVYASQTDRPEFQAIFITIEGTTAALTLEQAMWFGTALIENQTPIAGPELQEFGEVILEAVQRAEGGVDTRTLH
jgi:hypothetical protein